METISIGAATRFGLLMWLNNGSKSSYLRNKDCFGDTMRHDDGMAKQASARKTFAVR